MVLLIVKRSEAQQFLYEVPADTVVEEALQRVVNVNNLRYKIQRLKEGGEKLHLADSDSQMGSADDARSVCAPDQAEALQRRLAAAEQLQHKDQVGKKVALTEASLEEAVDDIRHAVAEAFPDGLLLDNPLMRALDGTEDLAETSVVVKLQRAGYGPPPREPAVDEETQKAMLAYYYKKQEDQKRLAADDTRYYDSAWANPRSLKNQFSGIGDVRLS
ncbi:hypothetical protein COCSUDRAFT_56132 [Coccomyxa subellipsoidea C-169]|uniref:Uncharacterized protein n=1 Tax=Coccomyxa subellipsoidea (strain C-169) TaxID=574566 RepID=I0YVM9_COCSC|nr:hypothetical protein COCSUDRAFT_56132 [Coccomyxa subellipsoidea C-169]EIE22448.1 hypothetical protein COCSUDRAFT_56132 [Coccomyxa subellipsoidea C-169]|eukprot:XP_005646992.1 hypothetical protein COCSUDRAFT_56132 [Coccomyxa subellipsoidea C-169]